MSAKKMEWERAPCPRNEGQVRHQKEEQQTNGRSEDERTRSSEVRKYKVRTIPTLKKKKEKR